MEKAKEAEKIPKPPGFFGLRHIQFILMFLVIVVAYGIRTNMSVAIIAMMDTYPEWTLKDTILSSFFWGYVIPQIGAGQLVKYFGAKWFLCGTFFLNSLFSLLTPVMSSGLGETGVIICRVVQGFNQGFLYPSLHQLLGRWTAVSERSKIGSFVYTAGPLGTVIALPLTGFISNSYLGWPASFYLYGIAGIIWCILWAFIGSESPTQHKSISNEEREYIEGGRINDSEQRKIPTPWKAIFTSWPFLAILVAHCGQNWGLFTLMTEIPSYMNHIMNFELSENGLLSALPYLALWLLSFFFGPAADYLVVKGYLSVGNVRKICNSIGMIIPAISLICLSFVSSSQKGLAISLLVVAVGFNAAAFSGFNINHIDISPVHSGTLMGITNSLSNIFSILGPLVIPLLGIKETDPILWRYVFCITAGFYTVTGIFYAIFASGEVQPWNDPSEDSRNGDLVDNIKEKV